MREPQSRTRRAVYGLLLLALALFVAGCVGVSAPVPTPAPQAGTPAPAEQATQQPGATTAPAMAADVPVGVDAEGNFYRGNPNAAVKLVEWSDFQ